MGTPVLLLAAPVRNSCGGKPTFEVSAPCQMLPEIRKVSSFKASLFWGLGTGDINPLLELFILWGRLKRLWLPDAPLLFGHLIRHDPETVKVLQQVLGRLLDSPRGIETKRL